jgi:predicted NUDIX family NTP pyrophosphohydrolase
VTGIKQQGGKIVHTWAFKGDCDPTAVVSNAFMMEWAPRSGRQMKFPEIERGEFFEFATASRKIRPAQIPLVQELLGVPQVFPFLNQAIMNNSSVSHTCLTVA